MIERRVARRYALALIQIATTPEELDALRADVLTIDRAIRTSHDLRVFLRSPIVNKTKKNAALAAAFGAYVGPTMTLFLQLLCEKRRERVLPEIVEEFGLLYDMRTGIERPHVTSAVELSEGQKKTLEEILAKRLNKKVQPIYVVDKQVLGGVMVQIGDTIIDGSARHALRSLREAMLNAVG